MTASWNPDAVVLNAACAPTNTIYIRLARAEPLTFAGAEIHIQWYRGLPAPPHPSDPRARYRVNDAPCVDYGQTIVSRSQTSCSSLNRGTPTYLEYPQSQGDAGGLLSASWFNSEVNTACSDGLLARVELTTLECTDCDYGVDVYAYVWDGAALDLAQPTYTLTLGKGPFVPVVPSTWGAIKGLMRR